MIIKEVSWQALSQRETGLLRRDAARVRLQRPTRSDQQFGM